MKKLVIALVVFLALIVAADFGSAAVAEYQVAKQLRSELELTQDPAVRINGFPFLTQAVGGDYREVEVAADQVAVARLSGVGVEATLRHVRVPFGDLVGRDLKEVRVDEVTGRARIQASELGKVIDVPDLRVDEVSDADREGREVPENAVKLYGTVDVLGTPIEVMVIGGIELVDGQVQVTPSGLEVGGQTLPPESEQGILRLFTARIDPGSLPFGITPTSVKEEDGVLVVEGIARDLVLDASTTG